MQTGLTRSSLLALPERRRNYRFALTPLADAMFQLLIFFLLSSSLTSYSLLTVQNADNLSRAAQQPPAEAGDAAAVPPAAEGETVVWAIDREAIIAGGQRFGFDALDALTEALDTAGSPADVVLVLQENARVQDVTTVLARLEGVAVGSVRIATEQE